ncbi:hypothetical protein JW848_08460, partial [Candidatus Bipolaricaulota bacterium]|nr:hypothetical protein [Candidatus Bipolaricaulota bacterium]
GIERIIVLGVLHRGCLARHAQDSFRDALDPNADSTRRRAALHTVGGAFLPPPPVDRLRFRQVDWNRADTALLRTDRHAITSREFSLDTFLAILSSYMKQFPSFSPQLLPIYVGVTRAPGPSAFAPAEGIVAELSALRTSSTALLATGDLIHYGPFYGVDLPGRLAEDERSAFRVLRDRLETNLAQAFSEGAVNRSVFRRLSELANDQLFILPIITTWLGPRASARLLSLEMVDYADILSAPRPCFVASTLAAYLPDLANMDSCR